MLKKPITDYQDLLADVNSRHDEKSTEFTIQSKKAFTVSLKSKGIKKNNRDGISSSDETCSNSMRFTGQKKEKLFKGSFKPNRIPLNRLKLKLKKRPFQNFLLSPQAL